MEATATHTSSNGFILKLSILFLVIMIGYFHKTYNLNSFFSFPKVKITSVQGADPIKD